MFSYFHKNKFNQGQLVPLFIIVIVILLMMALVTVNLGKLGLFKTESSNASDAGALAGGSRMANVFNIVAQANLEMEFQYRKFFTQASTDFVLALKLLIAASRRAKKAHRLADFVRKTACLEPCGALYVLNEALEKINEAIRVMNQAHSVLSRVKRRVEKYHDEQFQFYSDIRETAEEGRESAFRLAHKFSFMNSGIGSKLPDTLRFNAFLKSSDRNPAFLSNENPWSWLDGQKRRHSVTSRVQSGEIKKFKLQTTELNYSAPPGEPELLLLNKMINYSNIAGNALQTARDIYLGQLNGDLDLACTHMLLCHALFIPSCALWIYFCRRAQQAVAIGVTNNKLAFESMDKIKEIIPVALNGLELGSGLRMDDTGTGPVEGWLIGWIQSIEHDLKLKTSMTQDHAGADLGLWQTSYPTIKSDATVDFSGNSKGKIYPPAPKYNASIEEVDTEAK